MAYPPAGPPQPQGSPPQPPYGQPQPQYGQLYGPPDAATAYAGLPAPPASLAPPAPPRNPGAALGWIGAGVGVFLGPVGVVLGAVSIVRSRGARASVAPGVVAVVVGALQSIAIVVAVVVAAISGAFQTEASVTQPAPSAPIAGSAGDGAAPADPDLAPADPPVTTLVHAADIRPGDCLTAVEPDGDGYYEQIPCSEVHLAEVIHDYEISTVDYPNVKELTDEADAVCSDAADRLVPLDSGTVALRYYYLYPLREAWEQGDYLVSCLVYAHGDATLVGSATEGTLAMQ